METVAIAPTAAGNQTLEQVVSRELSTLRMSVPGLLSVLVATTDGLPLVGDCRGTDRQTAAAMAAAALGLGGEIAGRIRQGEYCETVTRSSDGYFVTYRIGEIGVLAVVAPSGVSLAMLHHEARTTAARLARLIPPTD